MRIYQKKIEFYDVDSLNVVWHGNYVKFIEFARCEFLKEIGYDYIQMKKDGFAYPVAKMDFKFIKPLFFGDVISIKVILLGIENFLKFKYEIFNQHNDKVCVATTSQVCVNLINFQTEIEAPEGLKKATKEFLCV